LLLLTALNNTVVSKQQTHQATKSRAIINQNLGCKDLEEERGEGEGKMRTRERKCGMQASTTSKSDHHAPGFKASQKSAGRGKR
jgi:hypothetical protein